MLRATWFYYVSISGWSESLWMKATDYDAALAVAKEYARRRLVLCGRDVYNHAIRISDDTILGDADITQSIRSTAEPNEKDPEAEFIAPAVNDTADQPWTSLKVLFDDPQKIRRGHIFMRGLPDSLFAPANVFIKNKQWTQAFDKWATHVKANFQMRPTIKATAASKKEITRADFILGQPVELTTAVDHGIVAGDHVYVGRVRNSGGTFFGNYTVLAAPTTKTLTLKDTSGTGAVYLKGGYVRKTGVETKDISNVYFTAPDERKPGRIFGSPVGRRKRRVPSL